MKKITQSYFAVLGPYLVTGFPGLLQMMEEFSVINTGSLSDPPPSILLSLSQLLHLRKNHRLWGILRQQFNRNSPFNTLPCISIFLFLTIRRSKHRRV